MKDSLQSPHDRLFRRYYANPAVAAEFLRHNLPEDVAQTINFDTLLDVPASYIDENLRESLADLIFKCTLHNGKDASIYILLEHKSVPEAATALQLLRYMVLIWNNFREPPNDYEYVPVIIPLVIYHGKHPWDVKPLNELISSPPELAGFVPQFRVLSYDLSQIPEEDIKGNLGGKAVLLLWKALQSDAPYVKIAQLVDLLMSALGPDKAETTVKLFFEYIAHSQKHFDYKTMTQELKQLPYGETVMKSAAVAWFPEAYQEGLEKGVVEGLEKGMERGMERGMEKGIAEGIRSMLQSQLRARFGSLPPSIVQKLGQLDANMLTELGTSMLGSQSLEEFEVLLDKALPE